MSSMASMLRGAVAVEGNRELLDLFQQLFRDIAPHRSGARGVER